MTYDPRTDCDEPTHELCADGIIRKIDRIPRDEMPVQLILSAQYETDPFSTGRRMRERDAEYDRELAKQTIIRSLETANG